MILNLKQFNNFAEKKKFKIETLQSILHLVTPNCWMTILDLLNTYLSVPVLPAHLYKVGVTVTFYLDDSWQSAVTYNEVLIHAPRPSNCSCPVVSCQI